MTTDATSTAAGVRASLIVTGDELLGGFVAESNMVFLARELRARNVRLRRSVVCGDALDDIRATVSDHMAAGDDLVVVTGGLGPTHDDRTVDAVAAACGRRTRLDEDALDAVRRQVEQLARVRRFDTAVFEAGSRKQATLPDGAQWVTPLGTAPAFVLVEGSCTIVVLPGPPAEMQFGWRGASATEAVSAVLRRAAEQNERVLRLWGRAEAHVATALEQFGHVDSGECAATLCARYGELELVLRGSDRDAVDGLHARAREEFGDAVFAVDDERSTQELVGEQLKERGLTVGVAESCTGGMLGALLTEVPGSSAWVRGGLIVYHNDLKVALAGVDGGLIAAHGAVSEPVARALAAGARSAAGADVGVGITGIAGPGGGTDQKPVGTVHIAVDGPGDSIAREFLYGGDRQSIRRRACVSALHLVRLQLAVAQP